MSEPHECDGCGRIAYGVSPYCHRCLSAAQAAAGEAGMTAAVDHAERDIAGWKREASAALHRFALINSERDFLAEEIAPWAYEQGCPPAPDDRAWGAIVKAAGVAGVIEKTGLAAKNKLSGHSSTWRPLWRTRRMVETTKEGREHG